jgi:putative ABC transport system permease protein
MDQLWGDGEDVVLTVVKTAQGYDVDEVADRVEGGLMARGSELQALTYTDVADSIGQITSTINAFLAGIAGISLLVGGVGVMNTMYTSVLERTKEIGVMKAVGAKNSHVLSIFLIESGLMGLVGGIVGTILGLLTNVVATRLISSLAGLDLVIVISPVVVISTLVGSFALGALAGLWPARRASKLRVVEALRYE